MVLKVSGAFSRESQSAVGNRDCTQNLKHSRTQGRRSNTKGATMNYFMNYFYELLHANAFENKRRNEQLLNGSNKNLLKKEK